MAKESKIQLALDLQVAQIIQQAQDLYSPVSKEPSLEQQSQLSISELTLNPTLSQALNQNESQDALRQLDSLLMLQEQATNNNLVEDYGSLPIDKNPQIENLSKDSIEQELTEILLNNNSS